MLTHCWQTREIERQRYMQQEEELAKKLAQAQAVPQLSSATLNIAVPALLSSDLKLVGPCDSALAKGGPFSNLDMCSGYH